MFMSNVHAVPDVVVVDGGGAATVNTASAADAVFTGCVLKFRHVSAETYLVRSFLVFAFNLKFKSLSK